MSSRRRRPGRTATLSPLRSETGASPPGSRRAPRPLVPCPARHPARSARPSTRSSDTLHPGRVTVADDLLREHECGVEVIAVELIQPLETVRAELDRKST